MVAPSWRKLSPRASVISTPALATPPTSTPPTPSVDLCCTSRCVPDLYRREQRFCPPPRADSARPSTMSRVDGTGDAGSRIVRHVMTRAATESPPFYPPPTHIVSLSGPPPTNIVLQTMIADARGDYSKPESIHVAHSSPRVESFFLRQQYGSHEHS